MLADRVSQLLRGMQTRPGPRLAGAATPAAQPGAPTEAPDFGRQLLQIARAQQEALQQGDMTQFRALAAQRAQMTAKVHQVLSSHSPGVDPQLQAELQRLDQATRQMLVRRYATAQSPPPRQPGTPA